MMKQSNHDSQSTKFDHDHEHEYASKSALKRKMLEFRNAATQLASLSKNKIANLPFTTTIKAALIESKQITNFNAQKRHLGFLTKLLSNYELEEITAILAKNNPNSHISQQRIHIQEKWLQYLINHQRTAVTKFIAMYSQVDAQGLNQLVRNAKANAEGEIPKNAETKLRKYLRDFFKDYEVIDMPPL